MQTHAKRILQSLLLVTFCTIIGCERSKEPAMDAQSTQTAVEKKDKSPAKKEKKAKHAAVLVFQGDTLRARIEPDEFEKLMTTSLDIEGKSYRAISLQDFLKKHRAQGNSFVLSGLTNTVTISRTEASDIYVYLDEGRMRLHSSAREDGKQIPKILVRVVAS